MNPRDYNKQVRLLLSVLPLVAKEDCFALHGGTAINLFHHNMPRLSIDIDLTYLPLEHRDASMNNIHLALSRIQKQIQYYLPDTYVQGKPKEAKLIVSNREVSIKVEVNTIKRGCFSPPQIKTLSEHAQEEFDAFCKMQLVDNAHLFGGKICAALDRQHPRDLFDIQQMFRNMKFDNNLKKGFLFYLISSNRPVVELLFPNLINQSMVFEKQFTGMTLEPFSYEDFETTRTLLIQTIHTSLSTADKQFLDCYQTLSPISPYKHDYTDLPFDNFLAVFQVYPDPVTGIPNRSEAKLGEANRAFLPRPLPMKHPCFN